MTNFQKETRELLDSLQAEKNGLMSRIHSLTTEETIQLAKVSAKLLHWTRFYNTTF